MKTKNILELQINEVDKNYQRLDEYSLNVYFFHRNQSLFSRIKNFYHLFRYIQKLLK